MIPIVEADLLTAPVDFIGHQCNCVTSSCRGLAELVFTRYPYAYDYDTLRIPGQFRVYGNGTSHRYIVNLFGQRLPGVNAEEQADRKVWFRTSLNGFLTWCKTLSRPVTLGLPYLIGCAMAGGNWEEYLAIITEEAHRNPHVKIILFRK
jgi:O-acetyl-ADP-ribose deacetylase (regulator of RNase III)